MAPSEGHPDATPAPLVVACLRIGDLRPTVDPLNGAITRDGFGVGLSAADAAGLEYALRIADAWSGRVVALCVGPRSVEPVLRDVAALGADVVRIGPGDEGDDEGRGYVEELAGDERRLARTLVAAIAPFGRPVLVLCGDRSADRGTGALPAFLAHELGAAQALGLVAIEVPGRSDGQGEAGNGEWDRALVVDRRLDGGWRERLRVPLPAVCSVEGAGVRLRRASLVGALKTASRPVLVEQPQATVSGPGTVTVGSPRPFRPRTRVLPGPHEADPRLRLLTLTGALVAHDPPTVVHPADPSEAADVFLAFLARHGYIDDPTVDHGPGQPNDGEP